MPAHRAPRCVLCEEPIEEGEPFKPVMCYVTADGSPRLPGKRGGAGTAAGGTMRLVNRGVHYSCELDGIAAAAALAEGDEVPQILVDDEDGNPGDLRENLHRLMRKAASIVDFLDELL